MGFGRWNCDSVSCFSIQWANCGIKFGICAHLRDHIEGEHCACVLILFLCMMSKQAFLSFCFIVSSIVLCYIHVDHCISEGRPLNRCKWEGCTNKRSSDLVSNHLQVLPLMYHCR